MTYLTVLPTLKWSQFKFPRDREYDTLLNKRTTFTRSGREAVLLGLFALRIDKNDKVLLPATICDVVLHALSQYGVSFEFYDLDNELQPDWTDIKKRICDNTKALYINHYFGRSTNLAKARSLCNKYGLRMIEDCAHAFSGNYNDCLLGSEGDISIFSFRKFSAIPHGGALVINNNSISELEPKKLIQNATFGISGVFKLMMRAIASSWLFPGKIISVYKAQFNSNEAAEDLEIEKIVPSVMSYASLWLFKYQNFADAKNKRVENYLRWESAIKDCPSVSALFKNLPEGSIPFSFPVVIPWRDELVTKCAAIGIYLEPSLRSPNRKFEGLVNCKEKFDRLSHLAEKIVSFPLHQSITGAQLDFIIKQVVMVIHDCTKQYECNKS